MSSLQGLARHMLNTMGRGYLGIGITGGANPMDEAET